MNLQGEMIPVLLGADLNCYSVARAFYEAYGVTAQAFGKYPLGATEHSRFLHFTAVESIGNHDICVKLLRDFAAQHPDTALLLLGCTDEYAEFLIDRKAELEDLYVIPYIDHALKERLVDKADFYALCDTYGIPYPKTAVVSSPVGVEALSAEALGFSYPIVLKPSSSIDYWHHPFDGMQKVYFPRTPEEASGILSDIYASGYSRRVVLQDQIPGGDGQMRVLTMYSDREGKVKMMCQGHVLLEEHTPKGRGNHAAILTEPPSALAFRLQEMLEQLGYVGFSNFDMKLDPRDGTFRVFEINLRQGRSNHYLTASGISLARLVTTDRILHEPLPLQIQREAFFWHSVPKRIVYQYTEDEAFVREAKRLAKEKKEASPLWNTADLRANPKRALFVLVHLYRQFGKYKKYCKKYR